MNDLLYPLTSNERAVLRRIADGSGEFLPDDCDPDYETARILQEQRLVTASSVTICRRVDEEKASLLRVTFVPTEAGYAALGDDAHKVC